MRQYWVYIGFGLLASGAGMGAVSPAWAQQREARLPIRPFALRDVKGWIEFEYEDETEERKPAGTGIRRREDRREFTEAIRVNTRSYFYHPFLADLRLDVGVEATQGNREFSPAGTGGSEEEDFFADTILANLTLLKHKPVVTDVFYQRQVTEREYQGFADFERELNRYGAVWRFTDTDWPASLNVSQRTVEGLGASTEDLEEREATFSVTNETADLDSVLFVSWDDDRDNFRKTDTETVQANLRQTLLFGDAGQHSWFSELRYFDQTGTLVREDLAVLEDVNYQLTDRWQVGANGEFRTVDAGTSRQDFQRGRLTVSHQLYESLRTSAAVDVQETESDTTETVSYSGSLSVRYRKQIPGGKLGIGLRGSRSMVEEKADAPTQIVFDEAHSFGPEPVILLNPSVVPGSVVITDDTGLITYVAGIDFLLAPRGQRVEVIRLVTGAIPPNGPILVDYRFNISSVLEYESTNLGANARVDLWEWLALYGQYATRDRTVTKGMDTRRALDAEEWLVGTEMRYANFTVLGELSAFDDGLSDYMQRRARASYGGGELGGWRFSASAGWAETMYQDRDEDVVATDFRVTANRRLIYNIQARIDAWLRRETGRVTAGDSEARGVRASLAWQYRQLQMRLALIHILEDDSAGQRLERDEIMFTVRRWF